MDTENSFIIIEVMSLPSVLKQDLDDQMNFGIQPILRMYTFLLETD